MRRSNYRIMCGPTGHGTGNPLWGLCVEITPEFLDFLRRQEPDREKYEELGLETLRKTGWPDMSREHVATQFSEGGICGWERGLLTKIQVPGNAAGLYFEESPSSIKWSAHNLSSESQFTTLLVIINTYFFDMESHIPRERRDR